MRVKLKSGLIGRAAYYCEDTVIDVTTLLEKQPKMYGLSNEMMYNYRVKITDEEGQIGFEDIDEPNSILPLFGDKIVLQCWSK